MTFTKSEKRMTVKSLVKANEKGQIRGDLAIQRNDVWDVRRQSLLIHSLIVGFPVPTIFVEDTGDKLLWLMDGKQRTSALFKYVGGGFPLHKDVPNYVKEDGEEVILAGKFFVDLDDEVKDLILDYGLLIWSFRGMQDEEKEEMFVRLNGGMPLKSVELLRVHAGTRTMTLVNQLKHMHFFEKSVNISKSVKNRFGDEESIFQIMYLLDSGSTSVGFSGNELRDFLYDIRDRGLEAEFMEQLINVAGYLGEALPVREGFLKKVNIPMLFYVGAKAMEMKVPAVKFGGWAKQFFTENAKADTAYSEACASGTGKADKVKARCQIMLDHFVANIDNASNYANDKHTNLADLREQAKAEIATALEQVAATVETVDVQDADEDQGESANNQEQDETVTA